MNEFIWSYINGTGIWIRQFNVINSFAAKLAITRVQGQVRSLGNDRCVRNGGNMRLYKNVLSYKYYF